ncbi:MAG: hypothetical protein EAZ47_11480 [Bacteroidetes bacterium]|nr:MAG: hypothetical protein EAY68_10350 [Bacteroidota bacterium]TAF89831.1 MAG: hypothetical protein EAZ47_11480 [Bacteroidota bacterium]
MNKLSTLALAAIGMVLLHSCSVISYSPKISLPPSSKTIPKVVMVETLTDESPEDDKTNKFATITLTSRQSFTTNVETEVTLALVNEFIVNGVFQQVSRQVANPDYIIKGKIKRFVARAGYTDYGIISEITVLPVVTWLFGMPIRKHNSVVDLTLEVYTPKGQLVGTYSAQETELNRYSLYGPNNTLAINNQANRTLSKAVQKIREQILADPIFK